MYDLMFSNQLARHFSLALLLISKIIINIAPPTSLSLYLSLSLPFSITTVEVSYFMMMD
jgi:hypothetical protein